MYIWQYVCSFVFFCQLNARIQRRSWAGGGVINSNLLISLSKFTEKRPRIPPPFPWQTQLSLGSPSWKNFLDPRMRSRYMQIINVYTLYFHLKGQGQHFKGTFLTRSIYNLRVDFLAFLTIIFDFLAFLAFNWVTVKNVISNCVSEQVPSFY